TQAGLRVKSQLDTNQYPAGIKVSDKQMAQIRLERDEFHGEWNYSILSRRNQS
ncbi:MAG: ISAzo13 family transposase, partial [Acidobacteriia bacterium]|nr:ISAzo13 family transposase [Terriglobia bacterium]